MSFLFTPELKAQEACYTSGTNFLLTHADLAGQFDWAFSNGLRDREQKIRLHLLGVNQACVNIQIPGAGFDTLVVMPKDSTVAVLLPRIPYYDFETIQGAGIFVSSTAPIGLVHSSNIGRGGETLSDSMYHVKSTYASAVLPEHRGASAHHLFSGQGQFYFGVTNGSWNLPFNVISYEDNNQIALKLGQALKPQPSSPSAISHYNGDTVFVTLNRGEVSSYYSYTWYTDEQINKGFIKSLNNKQFKVVLLPNEFRSSATSSGILGYGYEDTKPVAYAGENYLIAPLEGYAGNQYSLLALQDSTEIKLNGVPSIYLDSLDRMDTCLTGDLNIQSNYPIYVALSPCSPNGSTNYQESSLLVNLATTNERIRESLFTTLDEVDTLNHYMVQVVTKTNAVTGFLVNGVALPPGAFIPFSHDPTWSYANFEVNKGVHKLSSDSGFIGYHYTYYNDGTSLQYPNYAYVLNESILVSPDSLKFRLGRLGRELVPFAHFNDTICIGEGIQLDLGNYLNVNWVINYGDGTQETVNVGDNTLPPLQHFWTSEGFYWLRISDSLGCLDADSVLIHVLGNPEINFTWTQSLDCEGMVLNLINQSTGVGTSYQWVIDGITYPTENLSIPVAANREGIEVELVGTNGMCSDSLFAVVPINRTAFELEVPNVVTPNGDGINDLFCLSNLDGFSECFTITVFNRNGLALFKSNDPTECWDGSPYSDGVYFYSIAVGDKEFKGAVHLFK